MQIVRWTFFVKLYLSVIFPVLAQSSTTISLKLTKPFFFQAHSVFFSDPSNQAYPFVRSFKASLFIGALFLVCLFVCFVYVCAR
jgi:hypothetical protein